MKTIYLDCSMGAAGDMLMAALYEICPNKEEFLKKMNEMGLENVQVEAEPAVKCGITGTHMAVTVSGDEEESEDVHDHDHGHSHDHSHSHEEEHHHDHECCHSHEEEHHHHDHEEEHHHHDHDHEEEHHHHHHHDHDHEEEHHHHHHGHGHHHHASMAGISEIISMLKLPDAVKHDMEHVYGLIAEAEANAHGKPVDQIHFHEVGTMDAVADIAGVCLLMHEIGADRIIASPVHVGSGHVHCAHGILPVPAPATAHILQGIPAYSTQVKGELCTPTGAALLKYFVKEFREMPVMITSKIGYGMGKKDFERANCVRAFLGETQENSSEIIKLSCNLDDITAEEIGFAQERLFEAGALEVYTVAAGMKKSRPGVILTCICRTEDKEKMAEIIFRHTTTLGIREHVCRRYTLKREIVEHDTPYGIVREKISTGYGVTKSKLEYEDLARIAKEHGVSLAEARKIAESREK